MDNTCKNIKSNIESLKNIRYTYCYNDDAILNNESYCISLNYSLWLNQLNYEKYCLNLNGNNKNNK